MAHFLLFSLYFLSFQMLFHSDIRHIMTRKRIRSLLLFHVNLNTSETLMMSSAWGWRSCRHSLQILFRAEIQATDSSGLGRACKTTGRTLANIREWSANHSAKEPRRQTEPMKHHKDFGKCMGFLSGLKYKTFWVYLWWTWWSPPAEHCRLWSEESVRSILELRLSNWHLQSQQ